MYTVSCKASYKGNCKVNKVSFQPWNVFSCFEETLGCLVVFGGKPLDVCLVWRKAPGCHVLFGGKRRDVLCCLEESSRMPCVAESKALGCIVLF